MASIVLLRFTAYYYLLAMVLSYLDLRLVITFWQWYCPTSIYGFLLPFGNGIVLLLFTASYYKGNKKP
jgi:hypothetical protein